MGYFYKFYINIGVAELTQSSGAQLTNNTHFYCEKLNSYDHLKNFEGASAPVPPLVPQPMYKLDDRKFFNFKKENRD